jgi:hypothetical protein
MSVRTSTVGAPWYGDREETEAWIALEDAVSRSHARPLDVAVVEALYGQTFPLVEAHVAELVAGSALSAVRHEVFHAAVSRQIEIWGEIAQAMSAVSIDFDDTMLRVNDEWLRDTAFRDVVRLVKRWQNPTADTEQLAAVRPVWHGVHHSGHAVEEFIDVHRLDRAFLREVANELAERFPDAVEIRAEVFHDDEDGSEELFVLVLVGELSDDVFARVASFDAEFLLPNSYRADHLLNFDVELA